MSKLPCLLVLSLARSSFRLGLGDRLDDRTEQVESLKRDVDFVAPHLGVVGLGQNLVAWDAP